MRSRPDESCPRRLTPYEVSDQVAERARSSSGERLQAFRSTPNRSAHLVLPLETIRVKGEAAIASVTPATRSATKAYFTSRRTRRS
jgi:hypothetical protein